MSNYTSIDENILLIGNTYRSIIPRITASVSVVSSITIIYIIFQSLTQLNSIYHRLMFGMSIGVILMSFAISFTFLPMPRPGISEAVDSMFSESDGSRIGTIGTCELQGFIFIVGANLNYMYNGTLCWYYYCVIVRAMRDKVIRNRVEPFLHGFPLLVALVSGITFYIIGAYNPGLAWCTMTTSPYGCVSDCDSQRMSPANFKRVVTPVTLFAATATLFSMIFCLSSVYRKLSLLNKVVRARQQEEISDPVLLQRSTVFGENQAAISIQNLRTHHIVANRTTALQCLAYVSAWFLTVGVGLLRLLSRLFLEDDTTSQIIFIRLELSLQPLQGFFNLLIFISFKISYLKKLNPTMSYSTVIARIFLERTSDPIFLSRLTIVQEGNGRDIRGIQVENEFLDLAENSSLGHMNNADDSGVSPNSSIGVFSVQTNRLLSFACAHRSDLDSEGNNSNQSLWSIFQRESEGSVACASNASTVRK